MLKQYNMMTMIVDTVLTVIDRHIGLVDRWDSWKMHQHGRKD